MNKTLIIVLGIGGAIGVLILMCGVYFIGISNKEVSLRNLITAKQTDNKSEYDNMWKKIAQVAEVTDAQKQALKEIFVSHAQARTGGGPDKAIVKWVQESVPNVDTSTFNNLMNIISSSRDRWTMRQKELIDFKREHDNMIDMFPSNVLVGGRGKINITIVTSTKTEKTFETGKDDDVNVFQKSIGVEK